MCEEIAESRIDVEAVASQLMGTISALPFADQLRVIRALEAAIGVPMPPLARLDDEVRALERDRMARALAETNGNQTRAALLIGMPRRTFVEKLRQYDLRQRTAANTASPSPSPSPAASPAGASVVAAVAQR